MKIFQLAQLKIESRAQLFLEVKIDVGFFEPIVIATIWLFLRRTLVRSYRLSSKPQIVFTGSNISYSTCHRSLLRRDDKEEAL